MMRGLSDVVGRMKKAREQAPTVADRVLRDGVERMASAARAGTPVDTGELRQSWTVSHGRMKHTLTNTARHAPYVDLDTNGIERAQERIPQNLKRRLTRLMKE